MTNIERQIMTVIKRSNNPNEMLGVAMGLVIALLKEREADSEAPAAPLPIIDGAVQETSCPSL